MPNLTLSGNEITDVIRALGVQGDGLTNPDSSFGFFRDATNEMPNGGGETNTNNWNAVLAGVITTDATTFKFGSKSIKVVTPNVALGEGVSADTSTARAWVAGTWTCMSVWLKGSGTLTLTPLITNTDASTTSGTSKNVTLSATYTRYYVFVQTAVGKTGDKGSLRILTDVKQAATVNCDGCQIENEGAGPDNNTNGLFKTPTPYIHTDGATAQRRVASAQGLPSLPKPLQGWVAARVHFDGDSTDVISGQNPVIFAWKRTVGNDQLKLQYLTGSALWEILTQGSSTSDIAFQSGSWVAGDALTVVAYWTATEIGISVNGSSFGTAVRNSTSIPSEGDYGAFTLAGASTILNELNGQIRWFALGAGTITTTEATTLNALGNTDPTVSTFTDTAAVSIVWSADTSAYSVPFTTPGPESFPTAPITVKLEKPGRTTVDLSLETQGLSWGTSSLGGFADCNFTLEGDRRAEVPYLSMLRVFYGEERLWEGRVEDVRLEMGEGGHFTTSVTAFGLKRLLDWTSISRVWLSRDLTHVVPINTHSGTDGTYNLNGKPLSWEAIAGLFQTSAGTIGSGIYFKGTNLVPDSPFQAPAAYASKGAAHGLEMATPGPDSLSLTKVLADFTKIALATGSRALIQGSANAGVTWATLGGPYTATTPSISITPPASTTRLRFLIQSNSATPADVSADEAYFANIRFQTAGIAEDVAGGMYGGTILADLVRLVPGLTVGTIETGSDYAIQSLDAAVRRTAADVLGEVTKYYANREWAVWEDGRFDWRTHDVDQPQWMVRLEDIQTISLEGSLDPMAKDLYIELADPASAGTTSSTPDQTPATSHVAFWNRKPSIPPAGVTAANVTEVHVTSTDQRNPFVKTGIQKDVVGGFTAKTTTDATQVANRLIGDQGTYPVVGGSVKVLVARLVRTQSGLKPAAFIRAGDTLVLPDLKKIGDPFRLGRDGETYFHIVSTEADLESQTITLTLEGQTKSSDSLLARLGAAAAAAT